MIRKHIQIKGQSSAWLKNISGNILYALAEGDKTYINGICFKKYLSLLKFSSLNNDLYFFDNSKLFKVINDKLIEKFCIEGLDGLKIVSENVLFGRKRLSRKEKKYSLFDFNYNLLWTYTGTDSITPIKGLIFCSERFDKTKFYLRNSLNGKRLWNYQLPDGYTIYLSPKVIDDVLFIEAYNEKDNQFLVGINKDSGEVLWKEYFEVNINDKFIIAHCFNRFENLLYGCSNKLYQVFNPINGEVVLEKEVSDLFQEDFIIHKNLYSENKLWFVGQIGEKVKFGFFNTENQELELLEDFPSETFVRIQSIEYHKGKLYLLDDSNTLHIFEKEENNKIV